MPGEGRDLSSRQTQDVARDLEIGQPINSEQRSETADGVARESEGRTRLSVLRPLRQNQPRRYSGARLCPVPLQQGCAGRGWAGLRGCRGVWGAAMAWQTGACAQAGDLPTGAYQTRIHTEGQRQTQAAGLRYEYASDRLRLVSLLPERKRQFAKPSLHPIRLDILEVLPIHARRTLVGAALGIGVRQNIFAADFIVEGVEPIAGFCLRFRVQRRLQFLNAVRS